MFSVWCTCFARHPVLERLLWSWQEAELLHEWARRINAALKVLAQRPQTLLVLVNPFSGARRARRVWARRAAPVMAAAGMRISS
jgi:hypothetical protein